MSGPRVLVAGDFLYEMYEPAFCAGLRAAGAEVHELHARRLLGPGELLRRAQGKLQLGPGIAAANLALAAACARAKPDVVLLWRAPWARPWGLKLARAAGARRLVLYCNDDPFGPDRDLAIWRALRASVPAVDACFAYREVNLAEFTQAGARRVFLLRSWFDPRLHRPPEPPPRPEEACDAVFIGHCEPDGRVEALAALARAGLFVRLHGAGWERAALPPPLRAGPPLFGEGYARALAAARVALVFLSARNRDGYTRRCFEIPAVGALMLAPRTPELTALFREDEEAAFFSSPEELVAQATRYARDPALRARVAAAGRARCLRDGHDVESRARAFLAQALSWEP